MLNVKKDVKTGRVHEGVYEARMRQLLKTETAVEEEKH